MSFDNDQLVVSAFRNYLDIQDGQASYDLDDLVTMIKQSFEHFPKYDFKKYTTHKINGTFSAYGEVEKSQGALLVEGQGMTQVIAMADFKKEQQIILIRDPDGFGDRLEMGVLNDAKLYGIKDHFPLKK